MGRGSEAKEVLCAKCNGRPTRRKGGNFIKQARGIYFHEDEEICKEIVKVRQLAQKKKAARS